MANLIRKIELPSGISYNLKTPYYCTCSTAAATAAKTATCSDLPTFSSSDSPWVGMTIIVKFSNTNSAASPTIRVNSMKAKALMQYGTTAISTIDENSGWQAGAIVMFTYDGTNWVRDQGYNTSNINYNYILEAGD